ncbi:DUF3604 domain-containing protein [Falsihalocynthiibacter arcticus]|uniref:DUF3604 domain-containing protein n=1 Tax=Falsihalocynthiibacter arcticus TaxID=1579316 RepID=A0A126V6S6_9RHOB|nr:DUF3604 domain-containing protein [Falsihalocynthiibacter arcticus]AML53409.1 hypothetical protein RC74_21040 [Falsihalocynthiibacter arcticus]
MKYCTPSIALTFAATLFGSGFAAAQTVMDGGGALDPAKLEGLFPARAYSPYAGRNFPDRPFFGDTHLHTEISMDAGAAGARLSPADAYQFAKGKELTASSGQQARLSRPLDFLVVADHSDNMGFFPKLLAGDPSMLADPTGRKWYNLIQSGQGAEAAMDIVTQFAAGTFPDALMLAPDTPAYKSTWEDIIDAAEEANDPGIFTAFIGYEWTSLVAPGSNMHRNIIYRDGGDVARQVLPYTTQAPYGSNNPRDLWDWMENYEAKTGGDILAIAHNGNLSNGIMFPVIESFDGKPVDLAYAQTRAKWEPLYENTQMKGDGEAHPFLSPNDEFANFETWDKGNLNVSAAKTPEMLQYEYSREALKNGILLQDKLGVNPYKFGVIGSTDSHTGLATASEDNFFGKVSSMEPSAERTSTVFMKTDIATIMEWEVGAAGLASVWATDNTREAIFDAMARRETYATTGTRLTIRFFGAWDFAAADALSRTPAQIGYTKGVPMGTDLGPRAGDGAPTFLVAALKDPIGANLDRVQIVKGWVDATGKTQEKVFDVVWSDAETRQPASDGKVPAVGSTVDVKAATFTNDIGAPELITVWTDPEFDPALRAFYYARVLEIPTPRWPAYDAVFYDLALAEDVRVELQERGYTSPIWYEPQG